MLTACDPADLPEASTLDDPSEHTTPGFCHQCNKEGDFKCPHCGSTHVEATHGYEIGSRQEQSQRWRHLLLHISRQQKLNKEYFIDCVLIATGDPAAEGVSMTEFAKRWRVTKAAVSQHCIAICAFLKIAPSASMRSEAARENHRLRNVRRSK